MEWIRIKDSFPPNGEMVLLYDGQEVFCGDYTDGHYGTQPCDGFCYGNYNKNEITHWMPLPNKPREENK